jgi:hypothetical protein
MKIRPDVRAALAAGGADKARLDIRQPHVIQPSTGEGFDRTAAFVIRAIDQHTPHAAGAQFAERDFLRAHTLMIPR